MYAGTKLNFPEVALPRDKAESKSNVEDSLQNSSEQ